MSEFIFDELQNFEVPEGWIEKALDLPSKKKKPVLPVFYRYAIGAAACVVLAAAVSFSLMFGINKNVDLTDPNRDTPSKVEQATGESSATDPTGVSTPKGTSPLIFGGESQTPPMVTEPAEEGGNTADNNTANPSKQSSNRQAAHGGDQSNGNTTQTTVSSGESQPLTDSPVEPPDAEETTKDTFDIEPTNADYTPIEEPMTDEPAAEDMTSYFITVVDDSLAQGNVYCRLEDENGNIIGSKKLYAYSHMAMKYDLGNGTVRLTYLLYYEESGERYNVIFYNSEGAVLKQGSVIVYAGNYHYI